MISRDLTHSITCLAQLWVKPSVLCDSLCSYSPHHGQAHGPMHTSGVYSSGLATPPPGVGPTVACSGKIRILALEKKIRIYAI